MIDLIRITATIHTEVNQLIRLITGEVDEELVGEGVEIMTIKEVLGAEGEVGVWRFINVTYIIFRVHH